MINDMYKPAEIDDKIANRVISQVYRCILDNYGRKYKNLDVDIYDTSFNKNSVSCKVILRNNDRILTSDTFDFEYYDEYFDQSDCESHLVRSINDFVRRLF